MKKLPFLLLCLFSSYASAQTKELDIFNGLMYAPADMQQLKRMADSLGLQFRQCKSPFSFTAWQQALALSIELRTKEPVEGLIADLENKIDLKTFKARYGHWIVRDISAALVAYDDRYIVAGNANEFDALYADSAKLARWRHLKNGGWVYRTSTGLTKDGQFNIIDVWQLQGAFLAPAISETYGKLIAYVDCLVDNTTPLMLHSDRTVKRTESFQMLREYMIRKTNTKVLIMEELPEEDLHNYICAHYKDDETVRRLTHETLLDDMEGYAVGNLDAIAEEVVPKEKLLELLRSAQVTGSCSMDDRPRRHARNIAVLASQARQWPVFIKAHMNIMNDYMDRRTDGSYAQAGRKTYLKELDQLNINTTDLLLGSALRASNTIPGHYFGNAGRYGRAFSETKDPLAFEVRLKKMLKDPLLDDFNKLILFQLYSNYCYSQPSKEKIVEKVKKLKNESAEYPELISKGISELRTDFRPY